MKSLRLLAIMALLFVLLVSFSGCQKASSSGVPDTSSSPVAVSASGAEVSAENLVVPDKQIVEYFSGTDYGNADYGNASGGIILTYTDDAEEVHNISVPIYTWIVGSNSYASKDLLSVIGIAKEKDTLLGATSHNNGQDWISFEISPQDGQKPFRLQMGFTTKKDGWLIYDIAKEQGGNSRMPSECMLYQTKDGGITWTFSCKMSMPYGDGIFTFASPDIGWVTYAYVDAVTPQVFETWDGGATWNLSQIDLEPEMREGVGDFVAWSVRWVDGHWSTSAMARKQMGYPGFPNYSFSWNQDTHSWQWDNPDWPMPEGVNQIHFLDYVENYLYPPIEYDMNYGLDEETASIWLLFDAADFYTRTTGENLVGSTVPYALVNKMAQYQYGDDDFDASLMSYYNGLNEEGFINYEGHWPKGEGEAIVSVLDIAVREDGNIEAVIRQIHGVEPGDGVKYEDRPKTYQRSIFKPIVVEGVSFFTLLHSEQIDFIE